MISTLKHKLTDLVANSPLPARLHHARYPDSITLFAYNGLVSDPLPFADWCFISAEAFRQHLRFLSHNFDLISLDDALNMLKRGTLKGRYAAITFDDGFRSVQELALPSLKEAGAPATLFLTAELAATGKQPWFTRILQALIHTRKTTLVLDGTWPIATVEQKAEVSRRLQAQGAELDTGELETFLARLEQTLEAEPPPGATPFDLLDPSSVRALQSEPLISFGAHLATPRPLHALGEPRIREVLAQALGAYTNLTGEHCRYLAYPAGQVKADDQLTPELLREAGIECAVSMASAPVTIASDPLRLGRCSIGAGLSFAQFKISAHHFGT